MAAGFLLAAGSVGVLAAGWPADTSESDDGGPLDWSDGLGMKLAAMPGASSYAVFEACSPEGDIAVRLVSVEGVTVVYEAGGRRYTRVVDVRLGICASEPVADPTEYCR